MFKKLFRILFTILGAILGYGAFELLNFWMEKSGVMNPSDFSQIEQLAAGLVFAIIFGLVFFRLTPFIKRQSVKVADNIEDDLRGVSANDLLTGVVGLIIGLIIALLLTQIYATIRNQYLYTVITIITYMIMGYLGVVVANKKGKEMIGLLVASRRQAMQQQTQESLFSRSKKKNEGVPKIFDTSVIIDGRIAEIMKTGFLEGPIVIPEFVLVELRHIADSSDSMKRTRGRRGLDILNKIQDDYGIEIYNTDNEKSLREIPEVDVKLLKLAQLMNGKVVTNDFNLNKVAAINGVGVLNINELANTLKPVVIPGEKMTVHLVKQGKDNAQAIAYLDDGTMIVVEDGRKMIGKTCDINVTSVLQTSAGRMIFGRLKK
ncbi:PIN/TRAM domain-containing protein [Ihubacter sp. rT4E-8]|uniref:PIN/TRAM domain-containing protein n=1 Tax=unclassified Ihubacter TaxID=2633299 RepID=UPI001379D252